MLSGALLTRRRSLDGTGGEKAKGLKCLKSSKDWMNLDFGIVEMCIDGLTMMASGLARW